MRAAFARLRLGAVALILVCLALTPARAGVFNPEKAVLDNGLEIYVVTNDRAPVVSQYLWYRVGGADEPPGRSGIAHLLEHLMFKGTPSVPDGEFSKTITRLGGSDNAMTSWDFTAYFQKVHKDHLELVMRMEADRMANLILTEEDVLTERDVVLEERRQRTDSRPENLFWEQFDAALYRAHPYAVPIIGYADEIAALTREDALAHYRTFYAPNNAALFIVGDVTMEEVLPLAEKYYGVLEAKPVPERRWTRVPPLTVNTTIEQSHPQVNQARWLRAWLAPSLTSEGREHAYALQVLSTILADGPTSRLYDRLVVEERLLSGIGTSYNASSRALSNFIIIATPRPDTDMDQVAAIITEEIQRLLDEGVTAEEIARARRQVTAQSVFAQDSFAAAAYYLGMAWTAGLDVEQQDQWLERLQAVDAEAVRAAAAHVFEETAHLTGILTPEAQSAQEALQ